MEDLEEYALTSARGIVIAIGIYATVLLNVFGAVFANSHAVALIILNSFGLAAGAFGLSTIALGFLLDQKTGDPDFEWGTMGSIICVAAGFLLLLWSILSLIFGIPNVIN